TDIDECQGTNDCDPLNAHCTNLPGSYTCACKEGYFGNGRRCDRSPIGPCDTNNGGCDAHAICAQVDGAVTCTCPIGYTGDGTTCTAQSACLSNDTHCDTNATCSD